MAFWHSTPDIIERLASDTGKTITEKQVLTAALNGGIRLAAENPLWCKPGTGELRWFRPDGEIVGLHSVVTDGVVRWISGLKLEVLIRRGSVSLSGTQWQCGDTLLTVCDDAPIVTLADIRVPETSYPALLTAFGDVVVVRVPESAPTGLTKNAMLNTPWQSIPGFKANLKRMLEDVPAWLDGTYQSTGRPGGDSHRWNPALVGIACCAESKSKRWKVLHQHMDKFLAEYYPLWHAEWTSLNEDYGK